MSDWSGGWVAVVESQRGCSKYEVQVKGTGAGESSIGMD